MAVGVEAAGAGASLCSVVDIVFGEGSRTVVSGAVWTEYFWILWRKHVIHCFDRGQCACCVCCYVIPVY